MVQGLPPGVDECGGDSLRASVRPVVGSSRRRGCRGCRQANGDIEPACTDHRRACGCASPRPAKPTTRELHRSHPASEEERRHGYLLVMQEVTDASIRSPGLTYRPALAASVSGGRIGPGPAHIPRSKPAQDIDNGRYVPAPLIETRRRGVVKKFQPSTSSYDGEL